MERIQIVSIMVFTGLVASLWISKCSRERRIVRNIICCIYLFGVLYFTLISRQPSADNRVNFVLFYSFYRSLKYPPQPFKDFIWYVLSGRYDQVFTTIKPLETAVLNVLLFIPLGYLFPLFFERKERVYGKIVLFSTFCSLLIEIVQTITSLGWFDIDDLFCNVVGAVIGQLFFSLASCFL